MSDRDVPVCYVLTSILSQVDEQRVTTVGRFDVPRQYVKPGIIGFMLGLLLLAFGWFTGLFKLVASASIPLFGGYPVALVLFLVLPVGVVVIASAVRTQSGAKLGTEVRAVVSRFGELGAWHVGTTPIVPDPVVTEIQRSSIPRLRED